MGTIPVWLKDLIDRHNASGDDAGTAGMLNHYPLVMRIGRLLAVRDSFLSDLTALVERHESALRESQSQAERLKALKYPSMSGKDWRVELHAWMQEVLDAFLGFHVEVPQPPNFNRAQRRLMAKYRILLFFVPAIEESQYPGHMVKPDWTRYLHGADIQHIVLPGKWIAFEVIQKPNYQDCVYPDDRLVQDMGLKTRFNHPHSDKGEGDDLMQDILPKVADILRSLGGTTRVQSAEVFNFLGNLFNWATVHTAHSFPDLGSTASVEWCENRCGSRLALLVGRSDDGGLEYVGSVWRGSRYVTIAFRFLVQFPA